jgi:hypothetical protein
MDVAKRYWVIGLRDDANLRLSRADAEQADPPVTGESVGRDRRRLACKD